MFRTLFFVSLKGVFRHHFHSTIAPLFVYATLRLCGVVSQKSPLSFFLAGAEFSHSRKAGRDVDVRVSSVAPSAGDRSPPKNYVDDEGMQTAAKLFSKRRVKLSSDWGPANMSASLDVVDIFANNYTIFEPEVRRGFFTRCFLPEG